MKVLIFIVLKVVEIAAVVFGPYYLGKFVHLWTGFACMHDKSPPQCAPFWLIGLLSLCAIALAALAGIGIWAFCLVNNDLAEKIHYKIKRKLK